MSFLLFRLLGILDAVLNYDGVIKGLKDNTKRGRDLQSLIDCVRSIEEKQTVDRLASSLNKQTGKDSKDPNRVSVKLLQKTDRQPESKQDDEPLWFEDQYAGENLIDPLLEGITKSSLDGNSIFKNIFRDDIELVYFDDRYQNKVRGLSYCIVHHLINV